MKFLSFLLPSLMWAQAVINVAPAGTIVASFSDQGVSTIKMITGHTAPKNTTLISINVCNNWDSPVSISAARVLMAIANQSKQKPSIVDPNVIGLVLSTYGESTKTARLEALAKYATFAGSILLSSGAIKGNAGWSTGMQLGSGAINAYVGTLPPSANFVKIGQDLLQGQLSLGALGCTSGLSIAETPIHLLNEEVVVY
jgi:hypothetical protein